MSITQPEEKQYLTYRCPTCDTGYYGDRPDPSTNADPTRPCRSTDCGARLCPECLESGKAFICEKCGEWHCADHRTMVSGEEWCRGCAEREVPALAEARKLLEAQRAHSEWLHGQLASKIGSTAEARDLCADWWRRRAAGVAA